jgi:PIN domain nuclease of toxin-antitoxin system
MRILIDTHAFIWYVGNGSNLSLQAKNLIASDNTDVFISIVSIWEISIKIALRKLEIEGDFDRLPNVLATYDIEILPLAFTHIVRQSSMPFHHKDPFDRIIAAQALVEEIDLVSSDEVFDQYFEGSEVKRIW